MSDDGGIATNDAADQAERIAAELASILAALGGMAADAIDPGAKLTELGLDSLALVQASTRFKKRFGVRVTLGQLLGESMTLGALAEHIATELGPAGLSALDGPTAIPAAGDGAAAIADSGAAESAGDGATVSAAGKRVPLTDPQRDVWVISQLSAGGSAAYNISTLVRLKGELDIEALHEALRELVRRHESLRTTFDEAGGYQQVNQAYDPGLPIVDVSGLPVAERTDRVSATLDADLEVRYDLANGPLFRPTLIRSGSTDHTLVLSTHHLASDGWSFGVMAQELGAIYSSLVAGEDVRLEHATQYDQYVAWRADQAADARDYWLGLYDAPPVPLDLPVDKARPPVRSFEFGAQRAIISKELLAEIKGSAITQGVTPFIVLLAAWEIMLHRLSGQEEFTSGAFVAGQPAMGVQDLVGYCANLMPLRAQIRPDEPLRDYIARLQRTTSQALDNQHLSVGWLVKALHLPRDASRTPVVSAGLTLEALEAGDFDGLEAVASNHGRRSYGDLDLEAYLAESDDEIVVDFQYSSEVFEPSTIERWLRYYTHLLEQMVTSLDEPISALRLLDDAERRELLVKWNNTGAAMPSELPYQRFELRAAEHPDRVAIRTSGGSISYGELNAAANRLARRLRDVGVEAERLVGVHLERSPDVVVALLAIHKAGGAFLPLDPLYPQQRLTTIAEDAGVGVLVTQSRLADSLRLEGAAVIALDVETAALAELDDGDLGIRPSPSDLAYIISTSGSTGTPKGCEITHDALSNQLDSMLHEPGLAADDVLLAVTTMSFDPSLLELFLPLMVGASVVLADAEEAVDAVWLRDRLEANDITVMQATPATWQMLLDAGWAGTPGLKVLCGGEALTNEQAAAIDARVESLWNVYGTTETTVWSSAYRIDPEERSIPIGTPIANTEFHVLDQRFEPQPPGVPGSLFIGGVGLARGYRNRPDLTRERFVWHSFEDEPPRRLYHTGDLARRLADGRIEFLGRDDFQVKIRGYRIELEEIETVLARHPDVRDCAVAARADKQGAKRLVGYIVPANGQLDSVTALRMYLRKALPDYMVPAQFVTLDALPLSTNKKVDRARLPDPDHQRPDLGSEYVEPRTETEIALARIWERLLDVEHVGIEDNFYDLGGDSLLALRSVMAANRLGLQLTPNSIFQLQTISELALAAEEAKSSADDQGVVTGPLPLTPAQLRFLDERATPDPHHWNLPSLLQAEEFRPSSLRTAVEEIIRHHDALRLRLWQEDGRWRQEIAAPPSDVPLESHDLSALSAHERAMVIERVCTELQGSIDLEQGLLLRAAHFDCGPDEPDRFFVTIHHFAVDGLTWPVLWEDLEQAYRQADEGLAVSLPAKTMSFKTWATQLERLVRSPRITDTAGDWLRQPWHEVARLPARPDADPRSNTNSSTAVVELELSADETRRLLHGRQRPDHVIITALARCLSGWTASPTVLMDVLGHGRDAALNGVNLSRTVGFTLSYQPLVLHHPSWDDSEETVASVASQIDALPEGFSFELLRFLTPDEDLRDRLMQLPRAELLFNYRGIGNDEEGEEEDSMWQPAPEPIGPSDSPRGLRQYPIAVQAAGATNLRLIFIYSTKLHTASTIEARVAEVAATLRVLLEDRPVAR